ncbi:hypothetical protein [Streptomyces sp. NWU49]|uniref:hypothetical protein n=1 Tax=Streptomyces sp. NWU49 TaxID=2201153 RepID=UPI00215A724E|nr:hypothetical protein [Streptomyces sp. NWU49]
MTLRAAQDHRARRGRRPGRLRRPQWPGVKNALDDHLEGEARFAYLGKAAHSARLRAS